MSCCEKESLAAARITEDTYKATSDVTPEDCFIQLIYSQIWIEELAKFAPHEKLIFSTDQAFNDPRIIVGRVLLSDLDDALKRRILCENFEAALGRTLLPA